MLYKYTSATLSQEFLDVYGPQDIEASTYTASPPSSGAELFNLPSSNWSSSTTIAESEETSPEESEHASSTTIEKQTPRVSWATPLVTRVHSTPINPANKPTWTAARRPQNVPLLSRFFFKPPPLHRRAVRWATPLVTAVHSAPPEPASPQIESRSIKWASPLVLAVHKSPAGCCGGINYGQVEAPRTPSIEGRSLPAKEIPDLDAHSTCLGASDPGLEMNFGSDIIDFEYASVYGEMGSF